MQGISSVLWACSTLHISPLQGKMLESLVTIINTRLAAKDFNAAANMQAMSVIMCAFACLKLHIPAVTAELIVRRFSEGLVEGSDQPQGLCNIIWACAALGYSPPPHMMQHFMRCYRRSRQPFLTKHDGMMTYSLAVLGAITMDYFQAMVKRLPGRLEPITIQQIYTALQALRPQAQEQRTPGLVAAAVAGVGMSAGL